MGDRPATPERYVLRIASEKTPWVEDRRDMQMTIAGVLLGAFYRLNGQPWEMAASMLNEVDSLPFGEPMTQKLPRGRWIKVWREREGIPE